MILPLIPLADRTICAYAFPNSVAIAPPFCFCDAVHDLGTCTFKILSRGVRAYFFRLTYKSIHDRRRIVSFCASLVFDHTSPLSRSTIPAKAEIPAWLSGRPEPSDCASSHASGKKATDSRQLLVVVDMVRFCKVTDQRVLVFSILEGSGVFCLASFSNFGDFILAHPWGRGRFRYECARSGCFCSSPGFYEFGQRGGFSSTSESIPLIRSR